MYFAFGWPRALYTGVVDDDEEVVEMCFGRNYLVLVLRRCVQLWSGGQHRLKLGELPLTEASLQEDGDNQAAHWCSSRRMLAVLVRVLCNFAMALPDSSICVLALLLRSKEFAPDKPATSKIPMIASAMDTSTMV